MSGMGSLEPKPRPNGTSWQELLAWTIVLTVLVVMWFAGWASWPTMSGPNG
jgi:hypothetical protein